MAVIKITKGAHWREAIRNAFDEFQTETVDKEVEKRVLKWAKELMEYAVLCRKVAQGAHNITGNLLNSIVACVYKDGNPIHEYYSSESGQVRAAIHRKMTAPKRYFYRQTYDGGSVEGFKPNVETDLGYGFIDAHTFASEYRPSVKKGYAIAVAYTTEYAPYLETTGFENAFMHAHDTGREYGFKIKGMSVSEFVSSRTGLKQ